MTTQPQLSIFPASRELPPDTHAPALESYIPLRKSELVDLLADDAELTPADQGKVREFCRLIDSTIHYHFHLRMEELKDAYAPFDPDADEPPRQPLAAAQVETQAEQVFEQFAAVLKNANFRQLPRVDIENAIQAAGRQDVRLHVDFQIFDRLEVYARGDVAGKITRREWRNFFRPETCEIPTYQRMAVIFRLKPAAQRLGKGEELVPAGPSPTSGETPTPRAEPITLKLFKNIPKADLETLLPGVKIRMTLLDQGKIWAPTLSGLGLTAFKLLKAAAILAYAGVYGLLTLAGLVIGLIGYAVNAFFGYARTKDRYQLNLTRSLYFQNLDNNSGVLFRLLDEAEEQEFREATLAFWTLWRRGGDGGMTSDEIDGAVEAWLRERCGLHVDFEVADALEKLRRLNLIQPLPGKKWRSLGIRAALQELDRAWDQFFEYSPPTAATKSKRGLLRCLQAA